MKKLKASAALRLLPSLIWWIAVIVFAVTAVTFVSAHYRGEVPRLCGYSIINIVSDSMEDTIMEGDYILIKRIDPALVEEEDIICFYSTDPAIYGYPNTHRVVEPPRFEDGEYYYVTWGDHNPAPDPVEAKGSRLVGVYVRSLPGFTAAMGFIGSNRMVVLILPLLLGAGVLMVAAAVVTSRNEAKKKNEDGGDAGSQER